MITIHWGWILLMVWTAGIAGFMCCALLTMAKHGDEAIKVMKQNQKSEENVPVDRRSEGRT